MSVHVMQVMSRLFVVIRFKATDVSLSEVGCAPHLKKNSWKNENSVRNPRHVAQLAIFPSLNIFTVNNLFGQERKSISRYELEISPHQIFGGKLMPSCQTSQQSPFQERPSVSAHFPLLFQPWSWGNAPWPWFSDALPWLVSPVEQHTVNAGGSLKWYLINEERETLSHEMICPKSNNRRWSRK